MLRQRTLKNVIRATGVGLHTGKEVHLTLRPAPADSGIVFSRVDLPASPPIPALVENVVDTRLATTIAAGGDTRSDVRVSTVEHLLAALSGLGVDNALVELDAPEVPIMDGSAAPFVFLLESAGIAELPAPRRLLRIRRPVSWSDGDVEVSLRPHDGLRIDIEIDFDHPAFDRRHARAAYELSPTTFGRELCRARTFGFLSDLEALRARDLARGGSLDNVVVVGEDAVLNDGGLRYADEFVRHKMLDAIGDLALLGHRIVGSFRGYKSGHGANHALLAALLADAEAFELLDATQPVAARPPVDLPAAIAY